MLRFDPFSDLELRDPGPAEQPGRSDRSPRFMPMDLYKVDDHYVLTADLPGVDPGSVDVSVDNGTLTLTAHRSARSEDSVQWLTSERFFGTYRRRVVPRRGDRHHQDHRDLRERCPDRHHPARRTREAETHRGIPRRGQQADRADHHRKFLRAATYGSVGVPAEPELQVRAHRRPLDVEDRIDDGVPAGSRRAAAGGCEMPSSLAPSRSMAARLAWLKKVVELDGHAAEVVERVREHGQLGLVLTPVRRAEAECQV